MSPRQRRALRAADKTRRFEAARIRYAGRNHRIKYLVCFAFAGAGLVGAAICLTYLLVYYADYKYQTSFSELALPAVTKPCYVSIEIEYERACPNEFELLNGDDKIPAELLDVTDDPVSRRLLIGYDTDIASKEYRLRILPKDNSELKYKTTLEPPIRYIECGAAPFTDENSDLWIDLTCLYPRIPEAVHCVISAKGERYARIVFDSGLSQGIRHPLNLSEIMRCRDIDISSCDTLEFVFSIDIEDADIDTRMIEDVNIPIDISDWPGYDPSSSRTYPGNETQAYLDSL